MTVSWALLATVSGLVIALILGFRINHAGRKDTDAAIIRNQRVMGEIKTLLMGVNHASITQSPGIGDSRDDQRVLPDPGCPPLDTPAKG